MLAGLTGNIGSGKTTVLGLFKALGARVVSADEIVGRLLGEEEIKTKIRTALGSGVFSGDGSLDKQKTAQVVFDNEELRRKLEGIVHPAVMREIKWFALPDEVTIAEIPLLFEGGFTAEVDVVVTVTAPKGLVYERLGKKGIFSEEDVKKRLGCQIPDEQKTANSDFVVINAKDIAYAEQQVREIYRLLKLRHRRNV
ncbi:MAG: dephospho-CoA kinase [Nitrospirae bacterium]|nr:dephospho-CoA kinase [Nitrospirota bacterium]